MGDDEKESQLESTARSMLQIYHERSNQLANMLIALNGFILAFISGLLAFVVSAFFTSPQCIVESTNQIIKCETCNNSQAVWAVIIAINITIVMMIIWRYYAHYIDNDIASCYKKIFWFEHQVGVKPELTLLCNFETQILKLNKCEPYTQFIPNGLCNDQKFERRIEVFSKLIENKLLGSRGQNKFDFLALIFAGFLLIIGIGLLPNNSIWYAIVYGVFFVIYFIFFIGLFIPNKYVQTDPEKKDIERIIKIIKKIS